MKALKVATVLITLGCGAVLAADDLTLPRYGKWGFDETGMDQSVSPGADFDVYANGDWFKRTVIPADRPSFGILDQLVELSEARVHAILQDAAADRLAAPDADKIAAVYRSYMDEGTIDRLDDSPLKPQLNAILGTRDYHDVAALMGENHTRGYASIFSLSIDQDPKAPNSYALFVEADGLGLPARDYYLKDSFAAKKVAYQVYIEHLLEMIDWEKPADNASAIVAFETRLAEASWAPSQLRDWDKTYDPVSMMELKGLAPDFDWDTFLHASSLSKIDRAVATNNTAFPNYGRIFLSTPLPVLKAWLAFRLTDRFAALLSKRFVDAQFDFRNTTLAGQPKLLPRWRRAVIFANAVLGQAVGRVYVARYFPLSAGSKVNELATGMRAAMEARIKKLNWMSDPTKKKALEKLSQLKFDVGYPTRWRDYSGYEVTPTDLFGNRIRANTFEWRRKIVQLFKPVDRDEWDTTLPQTVSAYYYAANNQVILTAAILQPPFFDVKADDAINFAGVGGAIGHEISHGFDDQGRKFDGKGMLTDWWTTEDAARFKEQAERLGVQYSALEPLPGLHVNGGLTMGENIGDMGALSLVLDAYHASLRGNPAPVLDGFTGDQRVFLGWAQIYRTKQRDDFLRQLIASNPHSPPKDRVNGTIRNIDGWYSAFDIKPSDALYIAPENRVHIW